MPDATSTNVFPPASASPDFPRLEEEILGSWQKEGAFEKSIRRRAKAGAKDFVFYDGPPFGNGLPHYGHILASLIKDTVPRFWTMKGFRVERRFGWDCHGLPVEMEVQKTLGLSTQAELEAYGIARFNEECRAIVLRYTNEWRKTITRLGRWVDFDNDYKTMDPSFMETVWWVFRQLWDKGLVARGHRVMPYSWACGTPLSNFEANLNYQDVQDPSVTVRFAVDGEPGTWFLAWTTTPWTLPSNLALCVGPEIDYVQVEDPKDGARYVMAEACVPTYFGEPGKAKIHWKKKGRELAGRTYRPLFDYFAGRKEKGAFRVLLDDYVSVLDDKGGVAPGAGIVHVAPAFGEDDHRVASREGIELVDPVDVDGRFTAEVADFAGVNVKEADKGLIRKLKEQGSLFHQATIQHSYPFCWRTDTPLIYKAIPSWFVRVESFREKLVANNQKIHWVPDWVGSRRFGDWLVDARDWNVSRNRYWGSCIPIWTCDACQADPVCIGSLEELRARSGVHLEDLHKHFVDPVTWTCESCRKGTMRRVPEVFDCWFESGSMPYSQVHYPFENARWFEANFPADFIGEGLDQTRGWFYTLLVLSSALFDRPAFSNCIVNGLVLAADGKKMSKRLKNYTAPEVLMDQYGSDALRFYLLSSPVAEGQNLRMVDDEVKDQVKAVLLPLWNAYRFFSEYANADRYRPRGLPGRPSHPLDRYVLSELQRTVAKVGEAMEGYFLSRACRASSEFLETLNNWYIRRSRRRFWKTEDDADKFEAFETLYHVLATYTKVLAPFLPFLADRVHRNLTGGECVHLADWPAVDRGLVDDVLSEEVAVVRRVVSLGHQVRASHKAKTRQPLRVVQVAGVDAATIDANRDVILEELNVKRLEILADPGSVAKKVVKPDGRALGPRLKGAVKEVFALAREGKGEDLGGGRVRLGSHVLEPGEYEVAYEAAGGHACAGEGSLLVALDLTVDDELLLEGLANDLIRHVQTLRKDAGYAVGDRIRLFVAARGDLARAVDAHGSTIQDEVLARELVRTRSGAQWDKTVQVDVEGESAEIGVKRL